MIKVRPAVPGQFLPGVGAGDLFFLLEHRLALAWEFCVVGGPVDGAIPVPSEVLETRFIRFGGSHALLEIMGRRYRTAVHILEHGRCEPEGAYDLAQHFHLAIFQKLVQSFLPHF